ncbi:hypothetical protein CO018_02145 [Candidatus Beckwithbacteria bacterium CG_4_9_14_0_2_um_filter_47_11]|uniref:Large ribosomal subunit protein bL9 n=1 Tax=Candidatus Beckwithbacteria bacterium CG_4_9_14_0_2_um_filter_47_11 TaxID=1974494 RepID=A0A2M8G434_9BACT|nr:MAG: hypothetical protein CO018_02145 [Candidatus Beckwithbacteria bacterium CG_4_9_14_0_2_um_filter_47_11]
MKVILKATGEVKNVSLGHAVNYLLPRGLAVTATAKRIAELKKAVETAQEKQAESIDADRQQAERLDGKVIEFKGETVTKKKIAASLKIAKTNVLLPKPVRKIGEYEVELKFGLSQAKVKIKVVA